MELIPVHLNYIYSPPIYNSFAEEVTLNNTTQYNRIFQFNKLELMSIPYICITCGGLQGKMYAIVYSKSVALITRNTTPRLIVELLNLLQQIQ
jgi:hypothetical protein